MARCRLQDPHLGGTTGPSTTTRSRPPTTRAGRLLLKPSPRGGTLSTVFGAYRVRLRCLISAREPESGRACSPTCPTRRPGSRTLRRDEARGCRSACASARPHHRRRRRTHPDPGSLLQQRVAVHGHPSHPRSQRVRSRASSSAETEWPDSHSSGLRRSNRQDFVDEILPHRDSDPG